MLFAWKPPRMPRIDHFLEPTCKATPLAVYHTRDHKEYIFFFMIAFAFCTLIDSDIYVLDEQVRMPRLLFVSCKLFA